MVMYPERSKPKFSYADQTKMRRCLRYRDEELCNEMFLSSWPGERACPKCRGTVAYHGNHCEEYGVVRA